MPFKIDSIFLVNSNSSKSTIGLKISKFSKNILSYSSIITYKYIFFDNVYYKSYFFSNAPAASKLFCFIKDSTLNNVSYLSL